MALLLLKSSSELPEWEEEEYVDVVDMEAAIGEQSLRKILAVNVA